MITLSEVLYRNQIHHKSFHYQVCKEFYSMVPVIIYFPKNSYLVEAISRKLEAFSTAGLIDFWGSSTMDMKYLNFKWSSNGPKKLSLNHLSGTNQILISGLAISACVFFAELFWFRCRNLKIFQSSKNKMKSFEIK